MPAGAQTGYLVVEVEDVPVVAETFYILAGFEITSISPPEAHIGEEVTITGTGFGNDCGDSRCYVMLGDLKIDFFWGWEPSEIRFTIPSEAISGDLWLYSESVGVEWGRYIVRPRIWTQPDQEMLWPRSPVTSWGDGFGEQHPSSSVTFNGEAAQLYAEWQPGKVSPYVPDSVLGKDEVTVMLNVGGVSEKVGDIKVGDVLQYLKDEYRSFSASVWEPSFNEYNSEGAAIRLGDGSAIGRVSVENAGALPLNWTGSPTGFKFDVEFTEQQEENPWDAPPYTNTTTVKITGQINLNSYHPTVDVTAEYSFIGKIRDPQLIDYSNRRLVQIQGLPLAVAPDHPVLLPSGIDGHWSASGNDAQPRVTQVHYTVKRGDAEVVGITTLDWERLKAGVNFGKGSW